MFDKDTAQSLIESAIRENGVYADSADVMLAKVGRLNVTILSVLHSVLDLVPVDDYNKKAAELFQKISDNAGAMVIGAEEAAVAAADNALN
jgi:hypothetical protein